MNISYAHINAYVKGQLSPELEKLVETEADKDPNIIKLIEQKKDEIVLIKSLIPNHKSSDVKVKDIHSDLILINDDIIQEERVNLINKFAQMLNTTVIEF